jgi:hypothetical protein
MQELQEFELMWMLFAYWRRPQSCAAHKFLPARAYRSHHWLHVNQPHVQRHRDTLLSAMSSDQLLSAMSSGLLAPNWLHVGGLQCQSLDFVRHFSLPNQSPNHPRVLCPAAVLCSKLDLHYLLQVFLYSC